jgi:hypothetical protein
VTAPGQVPLSAVSWCQVSDDSAVGTIEVGECGVGRVDLALWRGCSEWRSWGTSLPMCRGASPQSWPECSGGDRKDVSDSLHGLGTRAILAFQGTS